MDNTVLVKQPGLVMTLHSNRLEIEEGLVNTKKTSLLLRSVTDVSTQRFSSKVKIVMQDGRTHEYKVFNPEKVRATIMGAL